MKFYGKCFACRKKRFFLFKARVQTPVGEAMSRELMCKSCRTLLKRTLEK